MSGPTDTRARPESGAPAETPAPADPQMSAPTAPPEKASASAQPGITGVPATTIIVSAAVAQRADGRLLVTRRLAGTHLEGLWEFPGGKCEPGETHEDCLRREMREELGVEVTIRERLLSTSHQYDARCVELHFFACAFLGEPHPHLGQETRWVTRAELATLAFPAADAELIARLVAGAPSPADGDAPSTEATGAPDRPRSR